MSEIVHISEAASLGIHSLAFIAGERNGFVSATRIAGELGVSRNHLSKILMKLAREGLVLSHRGPGGGFSLAKDPDKISLFEIYEAVEGPLSPAHCLLHRKKCPYSSCLLGGVIVNVNMEIKESLSSRKLSGVRRK
jgi:Rrf2 family protein